MPLSKDPEKRARQLAGLQRGREANKRQAKGNRNALTTGTRADASKLSTLPQARADLTAELARSAPVRDGNGELPAADNAMVEIAAAQLARQRHIQGWLDSHGYINPKGKPYPALAALDKVERQLTESLDRLGLQPRSRAALGVDLVRTVDVAQALSEKDPAKREALLKEAGVIEGSAEEVG